jgi:MoaA/NifB/PqqE/SkfB family radical SAM enzyme
MPGFSGGVASGLPEGIMAAAFDIEAYNRTRKVSDDSLVCHAPFVSLHFDPLGNAYACDSSYRHILGRYPQHSIREMWQGRQVQQLRTWIRELDLSHSCQRCRDQLCAGNYHLLRAKDYDHLARDRYPSDAMPRVLEFDASNVCNLGCIMCNGLSSSWIRAHREHLPRLVSPYDDAFVAQVEELVPGLEHVAFVGGEPFLSEIYYSLWDVIARVKPGLLVNITTNATTWNARVEKILSRLRCSIIVSMDSVRRDTYESIRINASLETTMRNLDRLREYCRSVGTQIRLAVCPMRRNWRELPEIVEFCNERGIEIIFNNVLHPARLSLRTLGPKDLVEVVQHLESHGLPAGSALERTNHERYRSLVNQLRAWREDARGRLSGPEAGRVVDFERLEAFEGSVRAAMLEWLALITNPQGGDDSSDRDLSWRLRQALEVKSPEAFINEYFDALGEIGSLLHADVPGVSEKVRSVGSIVEGHAQRAWFVEQLCRWDPDQVLTAVKTAPAGALEGWVDAQFASNSTR